MSTNELRDQAIAQLNHVTGQARQRLAQQQAEDVKIAQKVMSAHREAFQAKFPGQCEHIMRLIAERLQLGLRKDNPVELMPSEIASLAQALDCIYHIHQDLVG
jgi:tagatose-1,6-bisphosphate aldolase non-catalytic subunit AgaZ/GatZ